jgi:hypothetical protein
MGDAGACITIVDEVQTRVQTLLNLKTKSSLHTTPNTTHLCYRVANKAREYEWLKFKPGRTGNSTAMRRADLLNDGLKKIQKASILTFNKKVSDMYSGKLQPENVAEVDELPPPSFSLDDDDSN